MQTRLLPSDGCYNESSCIAVSSASTCLSGSPLSRFSPPMMMAWPSAAHLTGNISSASKQNLRRADASDHLSRAQHRQRRRGAGPVLRRLRRRRESPLSPQALCGLPPEHPDRGQGTAPLAYASGRVTSKAHTNCIAAVFNGTWSSALLFFPASCTGTLSIQNSVGPSWAKLLQTLTRDTKEVARARTRSVKLQACGHLPHRAS